jgi:hypothetical protein
LGDSVNSLNINHSNGLFAHVLTSDANTFRVVQAALVASGLPETAINLMVLPSDVGLHEEWTVFETVLRLFRFSNQTEGNAFLRSQPPVFYLSSSQAFEPLPSRPYKSRASAGNVDETAFAAEFDAFDDTVVAAAAQALQHRASVCGVQGGCEGAQAGQVERRMFSPLMIKGLECIKLRTNCLGDCPDAAYFGPNISPDSDDIDAFAALASDTDLHIVTLANHRMLNTSVYGQWGGCVRNNALVA